MKNASLILSSLAFIGVLVLFGLHFSGSQDKSKKPATAANSGNASLAATTGRIAFVDIDTLEAKYDYFKQKKEEFTRRQSAVEAELQRSAQQMQNDADALQRKAQAGTLTQTEGEAGQRRLLQMQQTLENRRQSLAAQLLKDQDAFNQELQKRLDDFLKEYNKDKGYDYILSYSKAGNILFASSQLDITTEVIGGMNERAKSEGSKDTTAKK